MATNLNRSGSDVSRVFQALGPFSTGAQPSLETLGDALRTGRPAVLRTRPLVQDVGRFAKQARPLSSDLDKLTASIDKTDGIERLMETIYFTTLVINGFDEQGYYQRANLLNNLCSTYQVEHPGRLQRALRGRRLGVGRRRGNRRRRRPTPPPRARTRRPSTGATSSAPVLEGLLGSGVGQKGREAAEGVRRRATAPARQGQARRGRAGLPAGRRTVKRGSGASNLTASPVLVGAVTLLVTLVAVYLSYNANSGLPFVPTYDLKADVPNSANLVRGNDVRIGGARVGTVSKISPVPSASGKPTAQAGPQAGPRHRAAARWTPPSSCARARRWA